MALFPIENVPQINDLDQWRSTLTEFNGLSKANRFAVQINMGNLTGQTAQKIFQDYMFLCENAEMPGRAFQTQDVRYYGPSIKFPIQPSYGDVFNMTLVCRSAMLERQVIDDWQDFINPMNTYDFRYKNDYSTTIDFFTFDEVISETGDFSATYKLSLINAWPIALAPVPYNWADDNFTRIQVSFAYDYWKRPLDQDSVEYEIVNNRKITKVGGVVIGDYI